MIVDLRSLVEKRKRFEFSLQDIDASDFDGVVFRTPVILKGELTKENDRLTVVGSITADVGINCTRCLEPVDKRLDFEFRALYVAPETFGDEKDLELSASDMDTDVLSGESLNIAEIAREQILLALPARFLCSEDCKGLCEKCGTNRNLINCNCIEKETDPRWDALRNLK